MSQPEPGTAVEIAKGVRCVLAPNPSPMTYWGTNTFLIGTTDVIVIDPGPDSDAHLAALERETKGARVELILVTHAHADHSPLAQRLSQRMGAPVVGFGPATAGRSARMQELAQAGLTGGGEGIDPQFSPARTVGEGTLDTSLGTIEVLHTPGHFAGHLSFLFEDMLFSGDHVMSWASSLVSPPDGDVAAFMATTERLLAMKPCRMLPGHGPELEDPKARLRWLADHRKKREAMILAVIDKSPKTLREITQLAYVDVPPNMLPAAARNVFAHLIDLVDRSLVIATPKLSVTALFHNA